MGVPIRPPLLRPRPSRVSQRPRARATSSAPLPSCMASVTDAANTSYQAELVRLWTDYNTDLPTITGQQQSIPMLVSRQSSTDDHSASTRAQWRIGVDPPGDFVCVGPKYQYPSGNGTHLTTDDRRRAPRKRALRALSRADTAVGL
jgi:hypothetical protein